MCSSWLRAGETPSLQPALDPALQFEIDEHRAETVVLDVERAAGLGAVEHLRGAEGAEDGIHEGVRVLGAGIAIEFEVDGLGIGVDEPEVDGCGGRGGAVLHGEPQVVALAAQVDGAVGEGPQVSGAAQGLAVVCSAGFAGVVHDDDGEVAAALQVAETGEEGGDLLGVVFIDTVKSDQGIEKEEAWSDGAHGFEEPGPIAVEIESQA